MDRCNAATTHVTSELTATSNHLTTLSRTYHSHVKRRRQMEPAGHNDKNDARQAT